jgi:hypothetical protein
MHFFIEIKLNLFISQRTSLVWSLLFVKNDKIDQTDIYLWVSSIKIAIKFSSVGRFNEKKTNLIYFSKRALNLKLETNNFARKLLILNLITLILVPI